MKCLFVRHPFAGWIVDGVKRIEYRTQPTRIRGKIGIIQSKTGTVIGTVSVTGCNWNESLEHYEWTLADGVRFASPVTFRHKPGAVVWIDVGVPENVPVSPCLSAKEIAAQEKIYEEKIAAWLHPEKSLTQYWIVLKDGSRKDFPSEDAMDEFAKAHRGIVDHEEIID